MICEPINILLFCENYGGFGAINQNDTTSEFGNDDVLLQGLLNQEKMNTRLILVDEFGELISTLETQSIDLIILDLSAIDAEKLELVCRVNKNIPPSRQTYLAKKSLIILPGNGLNALEGMMVSNGGIILDANYTLAKMTGYEIPELIGKNICELATPDFQDLMRKNIVSGYEKLYEVVIVRKDGSTFPVELQVKAIPYQGEQIRVVAIRDITERKQRQNSLREQSQTLIQLARNNTFHQGNLNSTLREITEAAGRTLAVERVGVWLYNLDYSKIQCVDLYEASTQQHSFGMELTKANYPNYFQALEAERSIAVYDAINDYRTRELSESYLTVFGIVSLLYAPIWVGGGLLGVVCHEHISIRQWTPEEENFAASIADFVTLAIEGSDRNAAQEALKKNEGLFRAIFERSSVGIGLADMKGRIVDINPVLSQMLGYSREELCGKRFTELVYYEDFTSDLDIYQQMIARVCFSIEMEKRFLHKNGQLVYK
jgi:PAS domain S-box-containing protein